MWRAYVTALRTNDTKKKYLEERRYKVIDIWECEYKSMRKTDEDLKVFRQNYTQDSDIRTALSVPDVLSMVQNDKMFGVVRCDIRVPDDRKEMFSEMCPIFKNVDIPFKAIGEHMQNFVIANN